MTFNVQLGKRLDRIISWLSQSRVIDVLCLQEFPKEKISYFIQKFEGFGYRFAPSMMRKKRIYGVLTIYKKNKYQCVRSSILMLDSSRFERKIFKNTLPRSCLVTRLCEKKQSFVVANVHLTPFTVNKFKYRQVEKVAQKLTYRKTPCIIVGDFNISSILGKKKFITIMGTYGYETEKKRILTNRIAVMKHQVDYVFVKQCGLNDLSVERVRFSDHYPVSATIVI